MTSAPQSKTEHLSISELLGFSGRCLDTPPVGWKHPKAIGRIPIGTEVYIQNLKSKQWEAGQVVEYWERGEFLEVRCAQRVQKIFHSENIVTKLLTAMI
jgi:hypothetical protein